MSSSTDTLVPIQNQTLADTPQGGSRGRGRGTRGGRSRSRNENRVDSTLDGGSRGGRRGWRNGRIGRQPPRASDQPVDRQIQADLIRASMTARGEIRPDADDAASDPDSSVCFICADPVQFSSIAPCNHVTCHICALRMRALYKNKACAHCRTESEWVIFSNTDSKRFQEFKDEEIIDRNDALGVKFENQTILDETTLLLRYNCPDPSCDRACRGWPDLYYHVRVAHSRVLCDLCSRSKKVFTHEHTLFTAQELRKHERVGDDQPGSENQSGFKGHPECAFCRQRFYSSDELYVHCREKHERCFLCDRTNPSTQQQYYADYDSLVVHFSNDHFMCGEQGCLDKKFVVFDSEMDLKAHQLEVHPSLLSKGALRDARRIDMRTLEDRSHHSQNRRDGGGGHGRGSGRVEMEEPIRTEQQMSRAELAYYRTLAVQGAQSTTPRIFGGQLTEPPPVIRPSAQATARAPAQPPSSITRPSAQADGMSVSTPPPRPPPRPADTSTAEAAFPPLAAPRAQAEPSPGMGGPITGDNRRVHHGAVIERANTMLRYNQSKFDSFKGHVSSYRQDKISAGELVELFWSLFDVKAPDLGKLIKELADLYDDEGKKQGLLKAWNNWKAINEDYPPFAGASSGISSSDPTQPSSSCVLKLKSSTSHSARSTTARQGAWGSAAAAPPPPLPSQLQSTSRTPPLSVNRSGPGAHAPTPWVAPSGPPTASSSTIQSNISTTRREDFPSLPTKPPPPPGWGPIKRREHGAPAPTVDPWGRSAGTGSGVGFAEVSDVEGNGSGGGGRKKKGKQKEVLFRVGL
ncbi:unnamed protein product [Tuber melanosporum]|uniref:RING-type E3 ubiquitin transferase n=1 Tax=Tuber melanosporum (strain Mel28) TaxID=656061 RepID=D5GGI9_TUBMM|nr:uncharacterized protein GSTUM_00002039001 [Tuber melanosporum]CAZ83632.1 unnamed protein product [Tuber melanosporum]